MMSFRQRGLSDLALRPATVWLLTDIAEAKGRQDLYTHQSPHVLRALREAALIQSAESSNRIEGITVDPKRLRPLVLGDAQPRDRSEAEVRGYREALNLIHGEHGKLEIEPEFIRRLHGMIVEDAGDAGQFKQKDNEIVELRPGQEPVVRFRPVSAAKTAAAVDELCLVYRDAINQGRAHPLVTTAAMVLDFLCIHPFRDGNGRVSRLLTLLAACQHGFGVGRYISLERLVEESKEDYYEVLARSSQGWHDGRHDLMPWTNYLLAILRRAYTEFEKRAGDVKSPRGAKADLVTAAIESVVGGFTVTDLERACPGVSLDWIRQMLKDLKAEGKVECVRRGRGAIWRKLGSNSLIR